MKVRKVVSEGTSTAILLLRHLSAAGIRETVEELDGVLDSALRGLDRPLVADVRIDPAQYANQL